MVDSVCVLTGLLSRGVPLAVALLRTGVDWYALTQEQRERVLVAEAEGLSLPYLALHDAIANERDARRLSAVARACGVVFASEPHQRAIARLEREAALDGARPRITEDALVTALAELTDEQCVLLLNRVRRRRGAAPLRLVHDSADASG
jgi:hypothetical protein